MAPRTKPWMMAIGDAAKIVAPRAEVEYEVRAAQAFQLRKITALEYPAGEGGRPALWPVVSCYVGDRYVDGASAYYQGAAPPLTVRAGDLIRLRLRNPLAVPVAWTGVLYGRAVEHVPAPRPKKRRGSLLPDPCHDKGDRFIGDEYTVDDALDPLGVGGPVVIGGYVAPLTADQLERMVREASADCEPPRPVSRPALLCVDCGHGATAGGYPAGHFPPAHPEPHCRACYDTHNAAVTRCCCGRTATGHCGICRSPRCDQHLYFDAYCATSDGRRDPGCAKRARAKAAAAPLFPQTAKGLIEAIGSPPGWTEADVPILVPPPPPPSPRAVIYCEAAPPREVVEAATCLLDGDECGGVPRVAFLCTHLKYTARMLVEWERHEAHQARWRAVMIKLAEANRVDEAAATFYQYAGRNDHDVKPPAGADLYGGTVLVATATGYGSRCALCGAWLRQVTVSVRVG